MVNGEAIEADSVENDDGSKLSGLLFQKYRGTACWNLYDADEHSYYADVA